MPTRWFRVPEAGSGTDDDPYRAELFGYEDSGIAWGSSRIPVEGDDDGDGDGDGDGEPVWVVQVGAPIDVLNDIASQPESSAFGALPSPVFNRHHGRSWNAAEWAQAKRVTDPVAVSVASAEIEAGDDDADADADAVNGAAAGDSDGEDEAGDESTAGGVDAAADEADDENEE